MGSSCVQSEAGGGPLTRAALAAPGALCLRKHRGGKNTPRVRALKTVSDEEPLKELGMFILEKTQRNRKLCLQMVEGPSTWEKH